MTAEALSTAGAAQSRDTRRAKTALLALHVCVAEMQAGIGPFLGDFLQRHGWSTGPIGPVMTLRGIAGMLTSAPAGALVAAGLHAVTVSCGSDRDPVQVSVHPAHAVPRRSGRVAPGRNVHANGAWPEHGIEGTVLRPNENGGHP